MPHLKYGISAALAAAALSLGCSESRMPADYGAPCSAELACGGDLQCVFASRFPGGYCSIDCTSVACGTGAVCDDSRAPALCLRVCTSDAECRDGYQCWRGACHAGCDVDPASCGAAATCGADGHCEGMECVMDAECGAGRRCDAGTCRDVGPPVDGGGMGANGTPCAADGECASGICLPPSRGGVCTEACSAPIDCLEAVDFEAGCSPVMRGGALQTLCIPYDAGGAESARPCATDAQCAAATCVAGQCTESCASAGDCVLGQICTDVSWGGGTFTGCGYAPGTGVQEIPLGEHDLMAGFGTPALAFATPPGSVSVTLRAERVSGDALGVAFYDVIDPRDVEIFSLTEIYELRDPPDRWIPGDGDDAIAMLVPNATRDRLPYVPGLHQVRVLATSRMEGDTGRARVRVSALVKRAVGAMLDVDVFLVGVGITAAAAPGSSRLQGALARFDAILSARGIGIGAVSYFDVTGAEATTYQVIDSTDGPSSELAGLFRLSSRGTGGNRLALFLVRSIEAGGDGFNTLGIAGGIPGPSGIAGSVNSGVVIGFEAGVVSANTAGHVMAHEVGHFLGLFHVTERQRPCGAGELPPGCAPFGGTDTIDDTSRGDTTNLMNWSIVGAGSNTGISAGQGFVLQRSAIVR